MKKSSANFIWCITYTTEGKICGKMAGMNIVVSSCQSMPASANRIFLRRHELFFDRRRKSGAAIQNTSENNFCLTGPGNGASFCKVCKCSPSFSARVPCHDGNNFGPSVAGKSENANDFRSFSREFSFLHFVQSLHKGRKHFRQNGGYESRSAWSLPVPTSPEQRLPPASRKLCGKRTSRPRKSDRLTDGSVGILHFVPVGHIWPTNLGYDAAK